MWKFRTWRSAGGGNDGEKAIVVRPRRVEERANRVVLVPSILTTLRSTDTDLYLFDVSYPSYTVRIYYV